MVLTLDDNSPLGSFCIARNLARQYDFLEHAFLIWQQNVGFSVDHRFIGELNFYGVQFVSTHPGIYRSRFQGNVVINGSAHQPPPWEEVDGHMDNFLTSYEQLFPTLDAIQLAAYVLWRINWVHPFIQGNGRSARALCYFVLCQKLQTWLPGSPLIPELIRGSRDEYCNLLRAADENMQPDQTTNLAPLTDYLGRLLKQQLQSVQVRS